LLLQQLARRGVVRVELLEVPVALWVVVVRVDDDLAAETVARKLAVAAEGDRDHDHVARTSGVRCLRRLRLPTELGGELRERLGSTRVAEHHLVAGANEVPCERAADVPHTDEPDSHRLSPSAAAVIFRW